MALKSTELPVIRHPSAVLTSSCPYPDLAGPSCTTIECDRSVTHFRDPEALVCNAPVAGEIWRKQRHKHGLFLAVASIRIGQLLDGFNEDQAPPFRRSDGLILG